MENTIIYQVVYDNVPVKSKASLSSKSLGMLKKIETSTPQVKGSVTIN